MVKFNKKQNKLETDIEPASCEQLETCSFCASRVSYRDRVNRVSVPLPVYLGNYMTRVVILGCLNWLLNLCAVLLIFGTTNCSCMLS